MRVLRCLGAAAIAGTALLSSAAVRATRGVLVDIDSQLCSMKKVHVGINMESVSPLELYPLRFSSCKYALPTHPRTAQAAAAGSFIHAWCGRGCCIATKSTGKASIDHVDFKCFATSTFSTTASNRVLFILLFIL